MNIKPGSRNKVTGFCFFMPPKNTNRYPFSYFPFGDYHFPQRDCPVPHGGLSFSRGENHLPLCKNCFPQGDCLAPHGEIVSPQGKKGLPQGEMYFPLAKNAAPHRENGFPFRFLECPCKTKPLDVAWNKGFGKLHDKIS